MRFLCPVLMLLVCAGCGSRQEGDEQLHTRLVTLPSGVQIRAEVMMTQAEMERGMKYRDALPQGRGMLFVHDKPAPYVYWMSDVKVPLDIVFMDPDRRIVEIAANTPPCSTVQDKCPVYGGHHYEQYVLELRAGEAQRLGLQQGQAIAF